MIQPEGYWRDYTGRFEQRPYFQNDALEFGAVQFLRDKLDADPSWPISDDDLEFIADLSASFDRGRDLSELGLEVDAVAVFSPVRQPRIILSERLNNANMRLRRRMTIAHELGHVILHQPLYQRNERQLDLLHEFREVPAYCHNALNTAAVDWCEWQANYFGGVLLAPKAELLRIRNAALGDGAIVKDGTLPATRLITQVANSLDISHDAARVRLAQVRLIVSASDQHLFPTESQGSRRA
jgi:Zn-dependent peptidase ImmA (M78 family)